MLIIAKIAETQRVHADNGDNGKTGLAKLQVVRSRVPAVTHVDSSARIQTVDRVTTQVCTVSCPSSSGCRVARLWSTHR